MGDAQYQDTDPAPDGGTIPDVVACTASLATLIFRAPEDKLRSLLWGVSAHRGRKRHARGRYALGRRLRLPPSAC